MKKSEWLDCQGNEFFPKQKGTPSLVKIEHKTTATLDSARSKKNLKSQFCNYPRKCSFAHVYWPNKAKITPNKHFDGGVGAVAPILK